MSSSSIYTTALSLLSFFLIVQTVAGIALDDLYHICSTPDNVTDSNKSPYQTNLNKLLAELNLKTPPTGFYHAFIGRSTNRAYGLSLCRGNIPSDDCNACVSQASTVILRRCPGSRAAIIWYDYCFLKYSDVDFFGEIDDENKFEMANINDVSDPDSFYQTTYALMNRLEKMANLKPILFAAGQSKLGDSEKLYGMVQCTRDLSKEKCKSCLDDAILEIPICCYGKEGARVVGGSCYIRYEIYPFSTGYYY